MFLSSVIFLSFVRNFKTGSFLVASLRDFSNANNTCRSENRGNHSKQFFNCHNVILGFFIHIFFAVIEKQVLSAANTLRQNTVGANSRYGKNLENIILMLKNSATPEKQTTQNRNNAKTENFA